MYDLGDAKTFYCGCGITTNGTSSSFTTYGCGYDVEYGNERSSRLEAEHVLPASWIAWFDPSSTCWTSSRCNDDEDGRSCCLRIDEKFNTAHNDLVNLYPAIGSVNATRSNYLFSDIAGEGYRYGQCDFEVDSRNQVVEPRDEVQGDIARIYYYMADRYDLVYPSTLVSMLDDWNQRDPVDSNERRRNRRIIDRQGSGNPFVR